MVNPVPVHLVHLVVPSGSGGGVPSAWETALHAVTAGTLSVQTGGGGAVQRERRVVASGPGRVGSRYLDAWPARGKPGSEAAYLVGAGVAGGYRGVVASWRRSFAG